MSRLDLLALVANGSVVCCREVYGQHYGISQEYFKIENSFQNIFYGS